MLDGEEEVSRPLVGGVEYFQDLIGIGDLEFERLVIRVFIKSGEGLPVGFFTKPGNLVRTEILIVGDLRTDLGEVGSCLSENRFRVLDTP